MVLSEWFQLKDKKAIVTGSSKGLGREIAICLAEQGASLVLADLVHPEETATCIENLGSHCVPIQMDVSDEAAVKEMVTAAVSRLGKIDILVNNAGIIQTGFTPTEDTPVEEWDRVIQVNLRGTFLCSKYVGKEMIGSGGGNIINIASTAGFNGIARAPAYCASKAGVVILTKSLAVEWARYNIRVNAIAPHYLETEMTQGLRNHDKVYDRIIGQIPLRRFATPSEILGTVLLLASPASSYTTGAVFVVDGGFLAQ
ncbi:MAG: 3-oxoacyl-ACP reductase family protein [Thermodesulfobacteriota bacterium]